MKLFSKPLVKLIDLGARDSLGVEMVCVYMGTIWVVRRLWLMLGFHVSWIISKCLFLHVDHVTDRYTRRQTDEDMVVSLVKEQG